MKKLSLSILFTLMLVLTLSPISYAATGYEGYAVMNDCEKILNFWGHAGMLQQPGSNYPNAVIHIYQTNGPVKYDSWANYISGTTFYGVYGPSGIANAQRDLAMFTARSLTGWSIRYYLIGQINYPSSLFGKSVLPVSDITNIRCDGVVEYSYEYNNVKVYGGSSAWNISKPTQASYNEHYGLNVTPAVQRSIMTRITSATPTW